MFGGGFIARILKQFITKTQAVLVVLTTTIVWEIYEFFADGGIEGMVVIYGSLERYGYDTLGDIIGAMCIALMVIF